MKYTSNSIFSSLSRVPTICDPIDSSAPGFPVHHQLPELAQAHVHRVGIAIQPFHPLSSPSPSAFNLSQNQVFSDPSVLRIRWPKYWSFSISPSDEYLGLISFRKVKVTQSCPTLCDSMDYTVHGILRARILEWVSDPFSRGSSQPRG